MEDASGIPWVLIHIGAIVLALAVGWAIWRNRSRRLSSGEKSAQRTAAHRNFRVDEDSA